MYKTKIWVNKVGLEFYKNNQHFREDAKINEYRNNRAKQHKLLFVDLKQRLFRILERLVII